ncbi:MAG: alpha/beta hydrolase [Rhizomicrobium sp.]
MQQGRTVAGRAVLLCAALALGGCTFSDALKHDEIWSVRPGKSGSARNVLFATDHDLDVTAQYHVGRHWAAVTTCGVASVTAFAQVSATLPVFRPCVAAPGATSPPASAAGAAQERAAPMSLFADDVAAEAAARGCHGMLLYVHGYNTMFRTSLLHSGQIANDVHWPCAMALFSWSSEGQFDRYAADIERSAYSVPELISLLRAVSEKGLQEDILAHSMGARIVLAAAAALEPYCKARGTRIVRELILAAPDIGVEHYNDDALHLLSRAAACVGRVTIYASDNDMILIASEGVHGGIPRAGRLPEQNLQYAACEALDADIVDASLAPGDRLGHGYFINSYEMMDDITRTLAGETLAARSAGARATLDPRGNVAVPCTDMTGQPTVKTAARYVLRVAEDRRPSLGTRLLRHLIPLVIPVQ